MWLCQYTWQFYDVISCWTDFSTLLLLLIDFCVLLVSSGGEGWVLGFGCSEMLPSALWCSSSIRGLALKGAPHVALGPLGQVDQVARENPNSEFIISLSVRHWVWLNSLIYWDLSVFIRTNCSCVYLLPRSGPGCLITCSPLPCNYVVIYDQLFSSGSQAATSGIRTDLAFWCQKLMSAPASVAGFTGHFQPTLHVQIWTWMVFNWMLLSVELSWMPINVITVQMMQFGPGTEDLVLPRPPQSLWH